MKNLGKILFIVLIFPYMLFASVRASVDATTVELGDTVTYNLTITNEDIKNAPSISEICGSDVLSTSSQQSYNIINGTTTKSHTFSYQFVPKKSCVIEPVSLKIGSKIKKSNSVKIKVVKQKNSKDSEFSLTLHSDKKSVYVGESFHVVLLLKQKKGAEAVDSKFVAPTMKGFWVKSESKPTHYDDGDYLISKIIYKVSAQRVGESTISGAKLRIAKRVRGRDMWGDLFQQVKWKSYFSNTINIDVKALPDNVDLIGDFKISAVVDKKVVNASDAINVNVKVVGDGNLEDIKSFKPSMANVSVFDEKIVIKGDKLTQKLAFVSDENFTIPSFSLKFFDTKTKKIKTIKTKPINIKVLSKAKKEQLVVKTSSPTTKVIEKTKTVDANISTLYLFIAFFVGLGIGLSFVFVGKFKRVKKDKKVSIKDKKLLFMKLLPYKENEDVQEMLDAIEKTFDDEKATNIDKKALKKLLMKYKIV